MTSLPSVTVVVPTHDRPVEMRAAVQSVVDQDYTGPLDVVIVFDACAIEPPSLENPGAVTVRSIANVRTPGLAGARNSGILAATGALVAFLDDDDVWLPEKLRRQIAHRQRLVGAGGDPPVVGTAMTAITARGRVERRIGADEVTRSDLDRSRVAALHSSSLLFARSALTGSLGLIDEELPRGYIEDYDILLRAAAHGPIPVLDEPLVDVTWAHSSSFIGKWNAYIGATERIIDKHPSLVASRAGRAQLDAQLAVALRAAGRGGEARARARSAVRNAPANPKSWLALATSLGAISPDRLVRTLRRVGRGF